jgi:parallel beta-helix repeat protein
MIKNKKYKWWNILRNAIGSSILLMILGTAFGATQVINDCGDIDSSGDYMLGGDIDWSTGNMAVSSCIKITSNDVVFNGDSHYIIGNSAEVGTIGVYVNNPENSVTNVTVKNVTVTRWNSGIYLNDSSGITVTGNNASNNTNGINLLNSNDNLIYNNYFNNTNNVLTDSSVNYWNTTRQPGTNIIGGSYIGGNFWANPGGNGWSQTCAISNIFGMCDSPYEINTNNKDLLALTNLLPSARFISGTVKDSVSNEVIADVNISLDNGNWTITDINGYYSFEVTPGTYEITATLDDIRYYVNDSVTVSTLSGSVLQDILLVRKPTGTISGKVTRYSLITISSPENIMYHTTEISLVVSADKEIVAWEYSLNGAANVPFTSPETITALEGDNHLVVYAQDTTGNWDTNSVSFSVDSIPPASVDDLHNVSYAINYINWTWTDPADADFAKVVVYLDGVLQGEVPKGVMYYNATGLEQATYTIGTRTVDINGTENATMKTHTAATILPVERYINGTVMEKGTTNGIQGVTVTTDTLVSALTDETGFYSLLLTSGSFDLTASLEPEYYTNSSVTVSTVLRAVTVQDIELEIKPTGNITGNVTNV